MNNQVKLKSSLTRAVTLEGLDDVTEMTDAEIAKNAEAIRHLATSAHMHITRIGADRDKLKRQLKARPKADTPPAPTIKPGDKVKHQYGLGAVVMIDHPDAWVKFDDNYHDTLVPINSLEVVESIDTCCECGDPVDKSKPYGSNEPYLYCNKCMNSDY